MSYQVIARKYRPQSFTDLVGQDHISQTLLNALKTNRFPHALLFCGTRGVGKTSSARVLAKTLLCPNIKDFKPCNQCSTCQEITSGSFMDVIEIDGASNNGVDAIRELRETVAYTPANGKYKIYIIDEVHMLSTNAFNALLKTLEEPPSHVIFILATTEAQKIPITILSRCQRFDFRRISTRLIQSHLEKICKSENLQFDQEALWTLARLADGSMRDAQSLLDQVINFTNGQVVDNKVTEVLGVTDRELLVTSLKSLVDRNLKSILNVIEKVFSAGYDPVVFSQNLLEQIRHLLFVKISTGPTELLDLSDGEIQSLKKLCDHVGAEDIHMLFDMCLKGSQDLARAQNPRIVLEMLLLRMAQAPNINDIDSFLNEEPIKTSIQPRPPTTTLMKEAIEPPKAEPKKVEVGNWIDFIDQAKKISPSLGAQLEHTAFVSAEGGIVVLSVAEKDQFFYDQLKDPKHIVKLKDLFLKIWNMDAQIQVQKHAEKTLHKSPQEIKMHGEQQKNQAVRTQVENHPLVQSISKNFKTKITSIKEL